MNEEYKTPPPPQRAKRTRKRERIALVSTHGYVAAEPPLGLPDTGGQVVYVIELAKKLAQLGYQVDIWTRRFEKQKEIEKVDSNVQIIRMPCGGKDFIPKEYLYKSLPEWTKNALNYIHKKRFKYLFVNSHYWDAGLAGQHMAEELNTPHFHTPHSIGTWKQKLMREDYPDDKEGLEKKYNFSRRIHHENNLYRECDMVIATSPIQLDMFKNDYGIPMDKVKMIPPGYDDNRFYQVSAASRDSIRESMGYDPDVKVIACIGRMARNKGFDLLVDAFAIVAKKYDKAILRLAVGTEDDSSGPSTEYQELVKKIEGYGLKDRITLTGSVDDPDMPDFYRAADIFCLPSRYEPFGMTAIEAMACGTPTVVTTNGGLFRTLTYGIDALYADSFDANDFGYAILKALRHPAIHNRLAYNGAHKVRSLFTWTGIAQQLIKVVENRELRLEVTDAG